MNEIRFSQPTTPAQPGAPVEQKTPKSGFIKNFFRWFFMGVVFLSIFGGVLWGSVLAYKKLTYKSDSGYIAVFLLNGQVYFGTLDKQTDEEIVLGDVYYLKNSDGTEATATNLNRQFSMIKLGNEIHGPTDDLFITRSSILFYERLRSDSKVVETIKAQGK